MLVVTISINGRTVVSRIGARRISHLDERPSDDSVCKYEVGRIFDGRIKRPIGTVEHVYGDGAEVLAKLAVEKVVDDGDLSALEETNFEMLEKIYNSETAKKD